MMNLQLYSSREAIEQNLFESRPRELCVSVYLPRQSPMVSTAQRKFQLIKLLKQAERAIARDHGQERARRHMAGLWTTDPMKLIDESGHSIAIFHDAEFTGALTMPIEVPERVVVANSFHIKPVLIWLQTAPHYYLISLSAKQVKLYEGSPWDLNLVSVIHSPWQGDAEDPSRSRRITSRIATSERLRQFFLQAEAAIHPIIRRDRRPVVLAGVSRLHPIYRKINRDPDLAVHAIHGNVERWDEREMRRSAFGILERLAAMARERAVRELEDAMAYGHATDDLTRVARAAVQGKVRKILVASDSLVWGSVHPKSGKLTLHPEQLDSTDDDLLDDLAEIVLSKGGKVFCVPSAELPTASPVAALMQA